MLQLVQRNHEAYMPLLLLADPAEELVREYLHRGDLYAWLTEEEETAGVIHLLELGDGRVEVKNMAVRERYQGQGHGKKIMEAVFGVLKERGCREVVVYTGNSSIGNLAFYQKAGFRMVGIEPDYFVKMYREAIYENGIQCRDRIMLVCPL